MRNRYKKIFAVLLVFAFVSLSTSVPASAQQTENYMVRPGDTLWTIAVKNEITLSELIAANPQLTNPHLIYPYQSIHIPVKETPNTGQVSEEASWEQQVVDLVNAERAKAGLDPLRADRELARVARLKSADMRDKQYFSHQSPTYGSPFDMMESFGIDYRAAGENIAAGQRSPQKVMEAWMNSPGHRQNILNPDYDKIGVGLVKGGYYGYYWTQMFIGE